MNVKEAYAQWSEQYDTNDNRTRDLEAVALKKLVEGLSINLCLELGCGTGKNTNFLSEISDKLISIDFSLEMLAIAQQKITKPNVTFIQANLQNDWHFVQNPANLIVFSLVLEHIENLELIFEKAVNSIAENGFMYVGELHPFKQYGGTKARFETGDGMQIVTCFTHHTSDFIHAANKFGFKLINLNEYFDDDDKTTVPRIIAMLFQKK